MAQWMTPTPEQEAGYREWVASRPPVVRAIGERLNPWELYRLRSTGQRVTFASINEDGTVSVVVSGVFNLTLFDRNVFGINPDDLEPCELPASDEVTGAVLSPTDVDDNLDALRVAVRPDLWTLDADGKAQKIDG